MKKLYLAEINKELGKGTKARDLITEQDLVDLPESVQRCFRNCGYLGSEKMVNAKITWQDVYLKMSPEKPWVKLECHQFNSVVEPVRIVYMKTRILGLLPFEGRDKYQDGHGNMLIKLLKIFRVADAKGKEMDEGALVTVLAETFLVPSYALQPYIHWTAIDGSTAKATINHNGRTVSGVFHFNAKGEFIRFETEDRYYSEKGSEYKQMKWSGVVEGYFEKSGMKFPAGFKAIWHTEQGDYEYFKGRITDIQFNVS